MRSILVLAALVVIVPALDAACVAEQYQVWVPGSWQASGCSSVWVGGHYQVQQRVVCAPDPVVVYSRPAAVYIEPVCVQPVYVPAPVYARPAVSVSLGFGGYAYGDYGCRGGSGYRGRDSGRVALLPPPPLPHHFLPRPSRGVPDPLGIFRNDPLHLFRR